GPGAGALRRAGMTPPEDSESMITSPTQTTTRATLPPTGRIKLLLAYRHTLLRQALRTLLVAQGDVDVVQEAEDGKEAIEMAEKYHPDVVLMDTQLAVVSGIEATRLIRKRSRDVRVLLLTIGADDEYILQLLRAG